MKVKELQRPLSGTKVKIPRKDMHLSALAGLMKDEVYIRSFWEKGIWVKEDLKSERVFPLCVDPKEVLEWDVVPPTR